MRKVVALVVLLVSLACSFCLADSTSWNITITPWVSESFDSATAGDFNIGTWTGYTDDQDTSTGLDWGTEDSPSFPLFGVYVKGQSELFAGPFDFRCPITGTETKTWDVDVSMQGGTLLCPIYLTFTPGTLDAFGGVPVYSFGGVDYQYTFSGPMVPDGSQTFTADNPMPETWTWAASAGDTLTVTVSPVEQEGRSNAGSQPSVMQSVMMSGRTLSSQSTLIDTVRSKSNGDWRLCAQWGCTT